MDSGFPRARLGTTIRGGEYGDMKSLLQGDDLPRPRQTGGLSSPVPAARERPPGPPGSLWHRAANPNVRSLKYILFVRYRTVCTRGIRHRAAAQLIDDDS
jgi:hypothetical protein